MQSAECGMRDDYCTYLRQRTDGRWSRGMPVLPNFSMCGYLWGECSKRPELLVLDSKGVGGWHGWVGADGESGDWSVDCCLFLKRSAQVSAETDDMAEDLKLAGRVLASRARRRWMLLIEIRYSNRRCLTSLAVRTSSSQFAKPSRESVVAMQSGVGNPG
jgi:hypothetical protein